MEKTILVIGASGSQGGEVYKLLQKEKNSKLEYFKEEYQNLLKKPEPKELK
jgi:N-acetyl-gamma-glutamylphosphate reductase